MKVRRNLECPVCGDHPTITKLIDYHQFCGVPNPQEVQPVSTPTAGYVSDTEIDAVALKAKLDRGDKFQFIDVREPHEYQIAKIPGAKLIPLNDVPKRVGELDPDAETVVHCKMGGRSAKAADFLRAQGFKHVKNMLGGITAWSDKVDPSVPKY
jgi:adenylyltransferase/sulfurtransferase